MTAPNEKQERHIPLFINDNPLRRLLLPPKRLVRPYVGAGQVVADLGSGPGYYTFELAATVGPEGWVFVVDSDETAIRALLKKAEARGLRNIDARVASAADVGFIPSGSVDFVLANGLLCCVATKDHEAAANEIKRILKPGGKAFVSVANGPHSNVTAASWEKILERFKILKRGEGFPIIAHRWAVVSA
jgi:ubiquinone/menaquinone biosynthesis C-methylase UbiE